MPHLAGGDFRQLLLELLAIVWSAVGLKDAALFGYLQKSWSGRGDHLGDVAIGDNAHAVVVLVDDARRTVLTGRHVLGMFDPNEGTFAEMDFERLKRGPIHQLDYLGCIHGYPSR